MKASSFLFAFCFLLFNACNKSSSPAPGGTDTINEVKATVSVEGGPAFTFTATGSNTHFIANTTNGNTGTVISGSFNNSHITINLQNITTSGNYSFTVNNNPGTQSSFCTYATGNPLNPTTFYSTAAANGSGTFTISSYTTAEISGTFQASCYDGIKIVQITSGSFKGNF